MDFAKQLRIMRVARGLSQKELASLSGVPEVVISMTESRRTLISPQYEPMLRAALSWPSNADDAFAILASPAAAFEQGLVKEPTHA